MRMRSHLQALGVALRSSRQDDESIEIVQLALSGFEPPNYSLDTP